MPNAISTLLLFLASTSAQADPWAAPFCVVWPLIDNDHCDAAFGFGVGTCDSGYEATWMGTCEVEHDDSHDHWDWDADAFDHWHWFDFDHDDDRPPPRSPSPPPV